MIQAVTHRDRHTSTYTQTGRHTHTETDTFTVSCKHSQRDSRMSCKLMARMRIYVCMFVLCCPVLSSSLARLPHPLQCHLAPLSWHTENGQRASRINHLPPRRANDVVVLRDRPSPPLVLLLLLPSPCSSSTKRGR